LRKTDYSTTTLLCLEKKEKGSSNEKRNEKLFLKEKWRILQMKNPVNMFFYEKIW